jgi:hypothetical protein
MRAPYLGNSFASDALVHLGVPSHATDHRRKQVSEAVSGGGITYDVMHWVGDAVGGWYNQVQETIHNDPFRRQYQAV